MKICLVDVYVQSTPIDRIRTHVIIDDQSNYSLARAKSFEKLNIKGTTLNTPDVDVQKDWL